MEKLVKCLLLAIVMGSLVLSVQASRKRCIAEIVKARLVDYGAAYNSSDVDGLENLLTKDARRLPPGAPVVLGRKNVAAAILARQAQFPRGIGTNEAIIVSGTKLAILHNSFITYDENGKVLVVGKGINVWKKGKDGVWRLHWQVFNSDYPCKCP